jgi:pyrroloquinoline quinone biosynthesis protein B
VPAGETRGTAIAAILPSDAELDHVAGLLSFREKEPLRIYSSATIFEWVFEANSAFKHLRGPSRFVWSELEWSGPKPICSASGDGSQLRYEAIACSEKAPFYTGSPANGRAGSVLAYRIIDGHTPKSLLYVPVVRELSEPLIAAASRCDCLIFDGTFWSADEMSATGTGVASAQTMGHLPTSGRLGSIERLRNLSTPRKIYTHINNTNPILDESSVERSSFGEAGWEIAEHGMLLEI